jgi:NAD(P)-dependent dehydrogenase (short-subunit alcohol dehydrogenase family)
VPEKVFLNAGIMSRPPSAAIDDNIFDWLDKGAYEKVMNVNVAGALYGIRLLIDPMAARGGGDITVTASTAAVSPLPFDPFYCMSKHALVAMVKSFAPLYEQQGIRLNAFCPGGMATAIVPDVIMATASELMSPEDAALSLYEVSEKRQTGSLWLRLSPSTPLQEYVPPQVGI